MTQNYILLGFGTAYRADVSVLQWQTWLLMPVNEDFPDGE